MNNNRNWFSGLILLLIGFFAFNCASDSGDSASSFQSTFSKEFTRSWIGPEYWANRLQDWQVTNGRLECLVSDFNRNVYVLTRQVASGNGDLSMSVDVGFITAEATKQRLGW